MNQFDQDIKEKVNAKQYSYKAQYWKAFKRHSGMSLLGTGAKIALFSGMGAAVLGTALFFALRQPDNEAISKTQNQPVIVEEMVADSTSDIEIVVFDESKVKDEQTSVSNRISTNNDKEEKDVLIEVPAFSEEAVTKPLPSQKPVVKTINYGKPLQILVDTISSNDFPDYKTKPADELF